MSEQRKIVDSHLHFYDYHANTYTFLNEFDPNYAAFVGDYTELPRIYLPEDYLRDTEGYQLEGVVWHEFLSEDPIREAKWAQALAEQQSISMAMVTIVDFLDPTLEEKLEIYSTLTNVTSVREHMVWDEHNSKKRFAKRPDLLRDPNWQQRLTLLNQYNFKCGLEIFAPQLPDLINVIQQNPNIQFTIALMGWPLDISGAGQRYWMKQIKQLSDCNNICVDISAIECIFGMDWTLDQVKPWVHMAIETFGTNRCMFGSHLPIAKLSRGFNELYQAYEEIVADYSGSEKNDMFYNVAKQWFFKR